MCSRVYVAQILTDFFLKKYMYWALHPSSRWKVFFDAGSTIDVRVLVLVILLLSNY